MRISGMVLLVALGLSAQVARAEQMSDLAKFFEEAVTTYDPAVSTSENSSMAGGDEEMWYAKNFWLRLRPKFGLDVPFVAKFQVIPEVEMLWQRENPDGYSTYKP